jgi:hypothetical protein
MKLRSKSIELLQQVFINSFLFGVKFDPTEMYYDYLKHFFGMEHNKLTNEVHAVQIHSLEADSSSGGREIFCFLCSPKFHYPARKSPPPIPVLSQINSVYTLQKYFPKKQFNIVSLIPL